MPPINLLATPLANTVAAIAWRTVLVVALLGVGYLAGYRGADRECQADATEAALEATTALHTHYVAEMERGDRLAKDLLGAQRRIAELKDDLKNSARTLTGTRPDRLRLLHDAAVSDSELPQTTINSVDPTRTVAARDLGVAIVQNYATARDCQAQLNKLIDYIEGQP